MKKKKLKKQPNKKTGICKVVAPKKDDNTQPKKEPEFGTPEHVEQFKKRLEQERKEETVLKTTKPEAIAKVLEAKQKATKDDTILSFDRVTGELVVSSERIQSDDNVVVDQIYKDGFFNKPIAA
jgi:hypothetical protein